MNTKDPSQLEKSTLLEKVASDDVWVRRAALEKLGKLDPDAETVTLVVAALDDASPYVVRAAMTIAGHWHPAAAGPRVRQLTRSRNLQTRELAVSVLGKLGDESDIEDILRIFSRDRALRVRKAAGWTAYRLAGPATWRAVFVSFVSDAIPRHRVFACELAAKFGGREYIQQLDALLNDTDGHVRRAARKATLSIGSER